VIALPPSEAGAVQETVAEASSAVAETPVGASGAVAGAAGVTLFEAAESAPAPTPFTACTLNVYAVPFVRLEIDVEVTFPTVVGV
jgi:hypothetical protein